ncbi:hypothetical protein DRQ36_04010 [bacterium]|nr:MAG: hypothetical protein DRQ36_04010 [bacterium]
MKRKIIYAMLVVIALTLSSFAEPWEAEITLTSGSSDFVLTFGRSVYALDGLDTLDDILALPPPSGPYAYFDLDDPANPYITMLYDDIRPDDGDSALWVAVLSSTESPLTGEWNPILLPTGDFFIGAHSQGMQVADWINMKGESSVSFWPGQVLDIVHTPDGYLPEDDPVISNWYPVDGATGVPVTTAIRFEVTDAGSGVNPASITMTVNGADVSSELELTAISGGYRVNYEPVAPLPGETWISVIAGASDNAAPPHEVTDIIAFRTGHAIAPVLWELPLTAYTIDLMSDTSEMVISLGADPAASSGFDMGLDVVFPVAPPATFYSYFPLDDPSYPLYTMLSRDIHDSGNILDTWNVWFGNVDVTTGLRWEIGELPADKDAYIATTFPPYFPEDDDWEDMRTINFIEFGPGRQAWIKMVSPSGDTAGPRIVYTDPGNGETGVAVSTHIKFAAIDEESGVDESSITMSVNLEDVTSRLLVTASGGTTYVEFIPTADFDPLTTIPVEVSISDLADPANTTNYEWNFTTGYFLTPTWMESLTVWTSEPGEPLRHFTLFFGADPEGTDFFDYGLDQQMPPPPPGDIPYGYFETADTFWNQLARDIRSSEDDDILWSAMVFRISPEGGTVNWIYWDPTGLPEDGSFYIAWVATVDTVWENMRTFDRIDITTPGNLLIHFTRGVPPTYCLAGTVYADGDGVLEGAEIVILDIEDTSAISDSTGYYEICDIPPGTLTVITSLEDYISDTTEIIFDSDEIYNPYLVPIVPPAATVCGVISLDDDADPEGAMVVLFEDTVYADTTGYYAFYDVPYGEYSLTASKRFYDPETRNIVVDEPTEIENFLLYRKIGRLVGKIDLEDDPPNLSGTMVEITGPTTATSYTNFPGRYVFGDIPYGIYDISISHDGYITLDTAFTLEQAEDTLDATLVLESGLYPPRNLDGFGGYDQRAVLTWDPPEESSATLLGYNVYRERLFTDDTLVGYVPEPYTQFVEWELTNYLPYNYKVTAVYFEGESEPEGPVMVWVNPDSVTPDILIWDFDNGAMLADGGATDEAVFLQNRLSSLLDVAVTTQDANINTYDLYAYRAVFFIGGVYDGDDDIPNNQSINKLASYIASGGRAYVEGADFGYEYGQEISPAVRRRLFNLFGARFVADGNASSTGNVVSLLGENTTFFTEGVVDVGYRYQTLADNYIDEWDIDSIAEGSSWAMFSQDDPPPEVSNLRMLYREMFSWRTVLSSVYIGAMVDNLTPSTRQHVLVAIVNFLLGTDFTLVKESGKPELPTEPALSAAPNPFNSTCKLELAIDRPGHAELTLFDITGRAVITLADQYVAPGYYSAIWDAKSASGGNVPNGIYFAVLKLDDCQIKTRVVLVK